MDKIGKYCDILRLLIYKWYKLFLMECGVIWLVNWINVVYYFKVIEGLWSYKNVIKIEC